MLSPEAQDKQSSAPSSGEIIKGAKPYKFGKGKKALIFVHGWTSSPRELRFLAEKLKSKYRCYGILLEGHGTDVSHLENTHWELHLKQLTEAFSELSMEHESVSVVGLSYGATLALHLAARRKVSELVLLAPFIYSTDKLFNLKHESEIVPVLPKFIKSLNKNGEGPIYDKKALKEHISYQKMPVKPLKSVVDCAHRALELLPKIKVPVLLIHSTRDLTSDFESSVEILKGLGSDNKTLKALNKSGHIITLDYDREFVENEIISWLQRPVA